MSSNAGLMPTFFVRIPPDNIIEKGRKKLSFLNVFRVSSGAHHRPTFPPADCPVPVRPDDGFPDLDGGEGQGGAHPAGTPFDLQRIPDPRRRHEGGVNIRRQARAGRARRLDRQPSRPVCETGGHGAMQGALGVQMHRYDRQ